MRLRACLVVLCGGAVVWSCDDGAPGASTAAATSGASTAAATSGATTTGGDGGTAATGGAGGQGGMAATGGPGGATASGAGGTGGEGGCAGPCDPCQDAVQNGTETDVDCGGGACPTCPVGAGCLLDADCVTAACQSATCAATCTDALLDGAETDVDCGGPTCAPCPVSATCVVDGDCASGLCSMTTGTCAPAPTSCQVAGPGTGKGCGPGADEDCCKSLVVPGGTFLRSYDAVTYTDASNPATVSPYRLDRFEVTVGRYRQFINAGHGSQQGAPAAGYGAHPWIPGTGWSAAWTAQLQPDKPAMLASLNACGGSPAHVPNTWTDQPGAIEDQPINCLNFYEAFWFCAWDGGFMPVENEYSFAAAGGDEQRVYPWSSPPTDATFDGTYAQAQIYAGPTFVGSRSPKGDGRWGHADLGGNVWEWTIDYYDQDANGWLYQNPCVDCAELTPGPNGWRVTRGGGFNFALSYVHVGFRNQDADFVRYTRGGLRCARVP